MTTFERRFTLMRLLKEKPGLHVQEAAQALGVSQGTIRNDIRALAEAGQVRRVWGGAVVNDGMERAMAAYAVRGGFNEDLKRAIAKAACEYVQDGDAILLDASSTVYAMAAFLREKNNLTIVTNGIDVGREMARNPANVVVLLGGILRPDGTAVTRPASDSSLADLHIRTAFMSASGFSLEAGMTEADFQEASFKRAMVDSAASLVALIDSSKFGKVDLSPFAPVSRITRLITDDRLAEEYPTAMDEMNLPYQICVVDPARR